MKIYLAGPEVFFPHALKLAEKKKEICEKYGHEGLFPLDNQIHINKSYKSYKHEESARQIFIANVNLLEKCDATIANLTPFRSPSADAGTIWEIGYSFAKEMPTLGYTNLAYETTFLQRSADMQQFKDSELEDFGLQDNLMIPCCLTKSMVIKYVDYSDYYIVDNFEGFEKCVSML